MIRIRRDHNLNNNGCGLANIILFRLQLDGEEGVAGTLSNHENPNVHETKYFNLSLPILIVLYLLITLFSTDREYHFITHFYCM